jgi:hypothetical protein
MYILLTKFFLTKIYRFIETVINKIDFLIGSSIGNSNIFLEIFKVILVVENGGKFFSADGAQF